MTIITADIQTAITAVNSGGVIAYPTESVYGLGCAAGNQTAAEKILALKQRTPDKGMITLIVDLFQVDTWLDHNYRHLWHKAQSSWPAAITWLFPCSAQAPEWLTGEADKIALRCPDHALARMLCQDTPLISSSANPAGQPPAVTAAQVQNYFSTGLDVIIDGACGDNPAPSQIRDLINDKILR